MRKKTPASSKLASRKKPQSTTTVGIPKLTQGALAFLDDVHKTVSGLFRQFAKAKRSRSVDAAKSKLRLVRRICRELTTRTTLEREIFYPAVGAVLPTTSSVEEGLAESKAIEPLVADLQAHEEVDASLHAKVAALEKLMDQRVRTQRRNVFEPARSATALDLLDLRDPMVA